MKQDMYQINGVQAGEIGFCVQELAEPSAAFYPIWSWVWNGPISEELIKAQIIRMRGLGIRAVYIIPEPPEFRPNSMITKMTPEYLSKTFFAMIKFAVNFAAQQEMLVWLYDEGGWPSGSACGQVLRHCPQHPSKVFVEREILMERGGRYILPETALCAFTEKYERITAVWTAENSVTIYEYTEENTGTLIPTLLQEETVDTFIALTHERYAQAVAENFGGRVQAFFTDEPIVPYPYVIPDREDFASKTDFTLEEFLPAIFHRDAFGAQGEQFRIAYHEYVSNLFCDVYMKKLRNWCSDHALLLAGHMDGDHTLTEYKRNVGNIMQNLRCMDIPGVDVIFNQIYPGREKSTVFPRLASSAATQMGNARALSESFAVYGSGLSYQTMRYVINAQAVRGINLINIMSLSSGTDDFLSSQFRPNFMADSPMAKFLEAFQKYVSRVSYLTSLGRSCQRCAVYLPLRDIWSEHEEVDCVLECFYQTGREIESSLGSFDIIDDLFIESARVETGSLCGGFAEYTDIYVPYCKYMPSAVLAKLEAHSRTGGRVFFVASGGRHPFAGEGMVLHSAAETGRVAWIGAEGDYEHLRVSVRQTADNRTVYMIFNEGEEMYCGRVDAFRERGRFGYTVRWDDGALLAITGSSTEISLVCGEVGVLIFSDGELEAETPQPKKTSRLLCCIAKFDGTVVEELKLEEFVPVLTERRTALGKIQAGNWEQYVGKSFSGGIQYVCDFELEAVQDILIDLGEVRFCCEIQVNGQFGQKLFMPPYRLIVSGEYLCRGANRLCITVYNTPANVYLAADYRNVSQAVKGTYHDRTLNLEKTSEAGGLVNEVKIYSLVDA